MRSVFLGSFVAFATLATATFASSAEAAPAIDKEDYRLFCGYQDALETPKIKKLKASRKDRAIARMAKTSAKKLKASVDKVQAVGQTCDEVGKVLQAATAKELKKALPGRIDMFELDFSDPSHVVAVVRWKGIQKKKLIQDASLIAKIISDEAVITRTIALRAVNPRAKDTTSDGAVWWEAKTSPLRASRIKKDRIADFADSRYKRLFDGIVEK